MRALSTRNDDPHHASRPWDKDRDGFVIGEGCGNSDPGRAGVRQGAGREHHRRSGRLRHERRRLPHHRSPLPMAKAATASCAMRCATPVSLPSRSATSTPTAPRRRLGDELEATAVKRAFGDHAYKMLGQLHQVHDRPSAGRRRRPGSRDYGAGPARSDRASHYQPRDPDEGCDLDFVPNTARKVTMDYAMSNSFGFGGTNGCLVFKRWG